MHYRTPTAKPGEIKVAYGKTDRYSDPDLCVAWGAGPDMKCTGRLIMNAITEERTGYSFPTLQPERRPSLVDELEARGFDITTLRFSIQRKDSTP